MPLDDWDPENHPDSIQVDALDETVAMPFGQTTDIYGQIALSPIQQLEELYDNMTNVLEGQEYATDAHADTIGQYNRIIAELDSTGDEADLDEFLLRLMREGLVSDVYASEIDAYEERLPKEQNEVVNEISKSVTDKPREEVSVDNIQNSLRENIHAHPDTS
ncbi:MULTISPECIES: hypothetical protein [Halococcus]|uniref:Uncharacterized protein n=1 Tax=Halococcus salifodinae DSM 8989 TaxID=1227456 RepID=M0N675_9EURY|nr:MULTISPECIES: hypothetical protein [Halococcus]EMA53432.1 hypothetical protein C450_08977 [Halococcus salifodinae DSM 8989]